MKIYQKNLIDLFCNLVQIDSVSGEEEKVADYIQNFLKNKVTQVNKDAFGNVYARIDGQGEPLFLSAHMDTVEPGRGIKPIIKDGYIQSYGNTILGVDNKAALASILEVVQILKESKIPHRPIELIFTRCEESDASGGKNFDISKLKAKEGYCFDYCSPLGGIITSSPLNERCDIKLFGKSAHSTQPENGINILDALKEFLQLVKTKKEDHILFNIGQIEVGHVRNSIPSQAEIKAEIRSFDEESLKKEKAFLSKTLNNLSVKSKIEYQIHFFREYESYNHQNKKAKLFIEETAKIIEKSGFEPKKIQDWAISDANTFNKNLLCLNLSDGGENPHSTNERIKISKMEKLANLILNLVSNP